MNSVVACLLMLVAVAPMGSAQWPRVSLNRGDRDLYARIMMLGDTRTMDTTVLDRGLSSRTNTVRAYALLTLGQLGRARGQSRVGALRDAVRSQDVVTAAYAAYALGLWRDSGSVGVLTEALRADYRVAQEAAWALGQIGENARSVIIRAVGDTTLRPAVITQLLLAAAKLRPVPVESVTPLLHSNADLSRGWAAAYAIARTRAPAGLRALIRQAGFVLPPPPYRTPWAVRVRLAAGYYPTIWYESDVDARVRAEVARALTIQAAGDSLADTAFATLNRLVSDPHPHVRINALRSLATYDARARDLLVAGTRDADANVRIAAAQALGMARGLVAVGWEQLWVVDTSFAYRRSILESAFAQNATLGAIREWRAHSDWRLRVAVAAAVAASPDREPWRYVATTLAQDPDARVRAAGLAALTADTTDLSPSLRQVVVAALSDTSVLVRATAVRALRRWREQADTELVRTSLERAGGDRESDARVAAIEYLTEAWERDSVAMAVVAAGLRTVPPSNDPVARAAASRLSPLAHWQRVRIPARDRRFYEEVVDNIVRPALALRWTSATLYTERGQIVVDLLGATAPLTVHNFITLARAGRYDGLRFHRVVPNFVVQDGDPTGDGNGGPGYTIRDELNPVRYERGVVGMALSGPDTGGSQYFITLSPQPHLDGGYTVFGRVRSSNPENALDQIVQGDRILRVEIH